MGQGGDVIAELTADHRAMAELLDQIRELSPGDAEPDLSHPTADDPKCDALVNQPDTAGGARITPPGTKLSAHDAGPVGPFRDSFTGRRTS